ncbi:MAG TPA: hypothetical protein VH600_17755 [Burkholderiales bacterium]
MIAVRTTEAVYWLTDIGLRAASRDSGLPQHYQRILAAIHGPSEVTAIRAAVGCDARRVDAWLDELHTLGFVQTAHAAAACYLKAA